MNRRLPQILLLAFLLASCAAPRPITQAVSQPSGEGPPAPTDMPPIEATQEGAIPDCSEDLSLAYFGVSPVSTDDLLGIIPLGNLNPPGHTFPTDHIYLFPRRSNPDNPASAPVETTVLAPGNVWITSVVFVEHLSGDPPYTDYTIRFSPCRQIEGYFMHMSSLTDELLDQAGPQQEATCRQYTAGGSRYNYCERRGLQIEVQQGEVIGTAGGREGQNALDMGAMDTRVPALAYANPSRHHANPSRLDQFHIVCPIDYFEADARSQLMGMLGGWGGVRRTIGPVCGEVMQDIPGTAQGKWYLRGTTEPFPEDPHIALVHDNIDPTIGVFSVGTSVPGLEPRPYYFMPQQDGTTNLDFRRVTPGETVYCYGELSSYAGAPGSRLELKLLVQLTHDSILRVEMQPGGNCGGGPFAFSGNYAEFER